MKKIKVSDEIEIIKNKLSQMTDEICVLQHRNKNENYIVTYESNLEIINLVLSIDSIEDFTEETKAIFIISNEISKFNIMCRADFVTHARIT